MATSMAMAIMTTTTIRKHLSDFFSFWALNLKITFIPREGRRSSDGLVAQGIVAFQQRLYEKEKAEEVVNLHQVLTMMASTFQIHQ